MAESDLLGLPFPQEYGGAGADTVSYPLAAMESAHPGFAGPKFTARWGGVRSIRANRRSRMRSFRKRNSSASVVESAPCWRNRARAARGSLSFLGRGSRPRLRDDGVPSETLLRRDVPARRERSGRDHGGTASWMSMRCQDCTVIGGSMRSAKGPMTSNAS